MTIVYKFILFALLFNLAAFFVASTNWFPNTLYGNAVSDLSLDDPATLSSGEDIFMRMLQNDAGANPIASWLGLDATATFAALMIGFIGGTIILGIVAKGGGMTVAGMAIVSFLFYTMYANSKNFFDSLVSNLPEQTTYITAMIAFGLLFMFIILIGDFASGQKRSS